jgi:hypothetical protein
LDTSNDVCPYCVNPAAYDLEPREKLLLFERFSREHWRVVSFDPPGVLYIHREKHPVSVRSDFYLPCQDTAGNSEGTPVTPLLPPTRVL